MEFEIIGEVEDFTDFPRDLTPQEIGELKALSRLEAIKLHRQMTRSTLGAAFRVVRDIHAGHHIPL